MIRTSWLLLAVSLAAIVTSCGRAEDLRKVYSGGLDYQRGSFGHAWNTSPADVWKLTSFRYAMEDELVLELGTSDVVFGVHTGETTGKSVLWAALFPAEPGKILKAPTGQGEEVTAVWLRFHPSRVGELFPDDTVQGPGDPMNLVRGKRMYQYKISGSWQAFRMPLAPMKQSVVVDVETTSGKRRFYNVDTQRHQVQYVAAFEARTVPDPAENPIDEAQSLDVFDQAWNAFDREYAMFTVKPNVDWNQLREQYRPLARRATTMDETAAVVALLLSHLEDLHVWVKADDRLLPGFDRPRMLNASWKATQERLNLRETDPRYGVTSDVHESLGYINVWNLFDAKMIPEFDKALEQVRDTKGLILDLRFNSGGDELLGRQIAGRFAERKHVYSKHQFRSGPRHDQLGPIMERAFEPRGPWRYEAPVVVLIGPRTMSSAESLVLMMDQCPAVTTVGDRTAGSSGNPRQLDLHEGRIQVNLPRWLDLDPDGTPIDARGIQPDIVVDTPDLESFRTQDPVVERAVRVLEKEAAGDLEPQDEERP
jgi:hypothetical protein